GRAPCGGLRSRALLSEGAARRGGGGRPHRARRGLRPDRRGDSHRPRSPRRGDSCRGDAELADRFRDVALSPAEAQAQPKRNRSPSSAIPRSFVDHVCPAAADGASVNVPIVTNSPGRRGSAAADESSSRRRWRSASISPPSTSVACPRLTTPYSLLESSMAKSESLWAQSRGL